MGFYSIRLLSWFFFAAFNVSTAAAEVTVGVAVSIAPQKYFLEKIGGTHVSVTVLVPPGADPHVFEPKPRQLVALSHAKLYFGIGLPFERAWLPRIRAVNPDLIVVFTDEGIVKLPMREEDEHHGGSRGGRGEGLDPHVWLSPPDVKIIAASMRAALCAADPAHRSAYDAGCRAFIAEIDSLDSELRTLFSSAGGHARFMVFHPAWGYFAEAYGLEQVPIEVEGREPAPAELARLAGTAKTLRIPVIFVQPQKSARSAKAVADAVGASIVTADDLAENWTANLRSVARRFHDALR